MIHKAQAKIVHSPEHYEIDLCRIGTRGDIKFVLGDLESEPFATAAVVSEAEELLINYLVWPHAQEKAKKLRSTSQGRAR